MYEALSGSTPVRGLRLEALQEVTALDWQPASSVELPASPGVYGWFTNDTHILIYHGKGSGAGGLKERCGNELTWVQYQQARVDKHALDPSDESAWSVAEEAPVIREIQEHSHELWFARAAEASWGAGDGQDPPVTAAEWEMFITEISHVVTGRHSLLGGGAWEHKAGSLREQMLKLAWGRLIALYPHR